MQPDGVVLEQIVRRIVEIEHPEKVIIFGSRARGEAGRTSDLDILVLKESSEPRYRRSARLYQALADVPITMDIVVYTPEEAREWSQVPQAFVTTALREGRVVYERHS